MDKHKCKNTVLEKTYSIHMTQEVAEWFNEYKSGVNYMALMDT